MYSFVYSEERHTCRCTHLFFSYVNASLWKYMEKHKVKQDSKAFQLVRYSLPSTVLQYLLHMYCSKLKLYSIFYLICGPPHSVVSTIVYPYKAFNCTFSIFSSLTFYINDMMLFILFTAPTCRFVPAVISIS